jgi:alpha/beta superfamily hydrolase
MKGLVCFNHGKESGPWGDKISRLAEVARRCGYAADSLDYTGIMDPTVRVQKLLDSDSARAHPLVLVGSSMGSYVAAVASASLRPRGLFLLAPAFYIPEFPIQEPAPQAGSVAVVHGWNDDVIPFEHSLRYARQFKVTLHLVDSDHRLSSQLPFIESIFEAFLKQLG